VSGNIDTGNIAALANLHVNCPYAHYLQRFDFDTSVPGISYTCVAYNLPVIGHQCLRFNSNFNDYVRPVYLDRHSMSCINGYALTEFVVEINKDATSSSSNIFRFDYTCCIYFLATTSLHIENTEFYTNMASRGGKDLRQLYIHDHLHNINR